MFDPRSRGTPELLIEILGRRLGERVAEAPLRQLFTLNDGNSPQGNDESRARRKLAAARELVTRLLEEGLPKTSATVSPEHVREYLALCLGALEHEVFACVFVDTRHRFIKYEVMFRGTIDSTTVYPREVARRALQLNAAALVLAHNHPSGVPEPSTSDIMLTRRLIEALALLDIRVLDHIVIGAGKGVSFAERGLL